MWNFKNLNFNYCNSKFDSLLLSDQVSHGIWLSWGIEVWVAVIYTSNLPTNFECSHEVELFKWIIYKLNRNAIDLHNNYLSRCLCNVWTRMIGQLLHLTIISSSLWSSINYPSSWCIRDSSDLYIPTIYKL